MVSTVHAPVQVNAGDRGNIAQFTLRILTWDYTWDSDNSNSFRCHSDIILTLQMVEI